MKSFRQIQAVFLILLLSGSFFLHTFVHHSDCCGTGSHFSLRNDSVKRIQPVECTEVHTEFFCPVCAGMMNADSVPVETRFAVPIAKPAVFVFISELLATPGWLLPSPRGPPAIMSSHIG